MRPDDPYFNKLLRILSTRCMMPAQYFCSGEMPRDQWHHYGLAAPVYTHFTSPIRRYADVIVHRLLAATIGVIPMPVALADRGKQQDLCSHMNRRHKAAQHVQRASVSMHTLLYFKDRPCTETAYVSSVKSTYFTVIVPRFGIEGTIEADSLKSAATFDYVYDPEQHAITYMGEELELHRVQVFQRISVRIQAVGGSGGTRKLEISAVNESLEGDTHTKYEQNLEGSSHEARETEAAYDTGKEVLFPVVQIEELESSPNKKRSRVLVSPSSPAVGAKGRKKAKSIKALRLKLTKES